MAENLALISDRLVELKELQGDDEVVLPLLKDISSVLFDIISNGVGGPTEIAHCCSLVFSRDSSFIQFVVNNGKKKEMSASITEALSCMFSVLEMLGERLVKFCALFKEMSYSLFMNSFTSAAVKNAAAVLLIESLKIAKTSKPVADTLEVEKITKSFHDLLAKNDPNFKSATVRHALYSILGCLCEFYHDILPTETAKSWAKFLISQLKSQTSDKSNKQPEWSVIAGCLVGLNGYLHSYGEYGGEMRNIYNTIKIGCDPSIKFTRYETPLAALAILNRHGPLFREFYCAEYRETYSVLNFWATHSNRDLRYAGLGAYDSFIYQVSVSLTTAERKEETSKVIFNFFWSNFANDLHNKTSLKEVAMAVKGYGYFAHACKKYRGHDQVSLMFIDVTKRSEEIFLNPDDSIDEKITYLIQFLESLGSIINALDEFPETFQYSVEILHVLLMEHFPLLDKKYHSRCVKASFQLFLSISPKSLTYVNSVVFQSLIRICAHPPAVLVTELLSEEGIANVSQTSCTDFLPLWLRMTSPEAFKDLGIFQLNYPDSSKTYVQEQFYSATIHSALKLIGRLNLAYSQVSYQDDSEDKEKEKLDADIQGSYKVDNLQDHRLLYSLEEFLNHFLLNCSAPFKWFEPSVHKFAYQMIASCNRYPLISSLFRILSLSLSLCKKGKYFKEFRIDSTTTTMEVESTERSQKISAFQLFSKFFREMIVTVHQCKDDLLSSVLELILALPCELISENIEALIDPLKTSMALGLAEKVVKALEDWSVEISEDKLEPLYKEILPYFDIFLRIGSSENNTARLTEEEINTQKRTRMPSRKKTVKSIRDSRKFASIGVSESDMSQLKVRILNFLGIIGGKMNHFVLEGGKESITEKTVSWDMHKHLRLKIPFKDIHLTVLLDDFLPRICELSQSASNRQVKCAACELLHASVVFLIGTMNTQAHLEKEKRKSMKGLYKKLFPVLLTLSCDASETVSEQLFKPLMLQIVRWFSAPERYDLPESQTVIDAVMDGLINPEQFGVREFSAVCVGELFTWSLRHSRSDKRKKITSTSADRLLKKIISYATHPNSFYRLGACAALNSIYKSFRLDPEMIDMYLLELLATFVNSLAISHGDDEGLGSAKVCSEAIDHLIRIVEKMSETFKKVSPNRKVPSHWKEATLSHCVEWLFERLGSVETDCRLKCFQLIEKFRPLVKKGSAKASLLDLVKSKESAGEILCAKFEESLRTSEREQQLSIKSAILWFDKLLAALDCYCFVAESDYEAADQLFTQKSFSRMKIFDHLSKFIQHYARKGTESCGDHNEIKTPKEIALYSRKKCTVITRMFNWISLLNQRKRLSYIPNEFWTDDFNELVVQSCFQTSALGFDMNDSMVNENLSRMLEQLLTDLKASEHINKLRVKIGFHVETNFQFPSVDGLSEHSINFHSLTDILLGYLICQKKSLVNVSSYSQQIDLIFNKTAVSPPGGVGYFVQSNPNLINFMTSLLDAICSLESPVEKLVDLITDPRPVNSGMSKIKTAAGKAFFDTFSQPIAKCLVVNCELTVRSLERKLDDSGIDAVMNVIIGILDQLKKDGSLRRTSGKRFVHEVVKRWSRFDGCVKARDSTETQKLQLLYFMRKLLIVDSTFITGTTEDVDVPVDRILSFFTNLLTDTSTDMSFKVKLLDILPHFCFLKGASQRNTLESALDQFVGDFFPSDSSEYAETSLQYLNYTRAIRRLLTALELSENVSLLGTIIKVICREEKHRLESEIIAGFQKFITRQKNLERQMEAIKVSYDLYMNEEKLPAGMRLLVANKVLVPLLEVADSGICQRFYLENISALMKILEAKHNAAQPTQYRSQLSFKTGSFNLIALMYQEVAKDVVKGNINDIYANKSGMPSASNTALLTKVIELCREAMKEGMYEETNAPLDSIRFYFRCAAYNCLAASLVGTQNKVNLYEGFLFNSTAFDAIVDLQQKYEFPVEFESNSGAKRRIRTTRKGLKQQRLEARRQAMLDSSTSSVQFASSLFLVDTSVSDDVNQFDFTAQSELSPSQSLDESFDNNKSSMGVRRSSEETSDIVVPAELESDELNNHPCMETAMRVISHLDKNISPVPRTPGELMPKWMEKIREKLSDPGSTEGVKMFLCRLILNLESLFKPFAKEFLPAILSFLTTGCGTTDAINSYFVDLLVSVMSWSTIAIPDGSASSRMLVRQLMDFCMKNVYHANRQVFRRNLEIVKTIVELWKERVSFSTEILYIQLTDLSDVKTKEKVDVSAIQLLGILLSNKIDPFVVGSIPGVTREMFYSALSKHLNSTVKEIYTSVAEVIGMSLNLLKEKKQESELTSLQDSVCKMLTGIQSNKNRGNTHFVTILNRLQRYYPIVVDRFMSQLLFLIPQLYGSSKVECFDCILARADQYPDVFRELRAKNIQSLMRSRDDEVQKVILKILLKLHKNLPVDQLHYIIPTVVETNNFSGEVRRFAYAIAKSVYNEFKDSSDHQEIKSLCKECLIKGLSDSDEQLRREMIDFWNSVDQLPLDDLPTRLLLMLRNMYSSNNEELFLATSNFLLLEAASVAPGFKTSLFDTDLTADANTFKEYKIEAHWKQKTTAMQTPMFIASQNRSQQQSQEFGLIATVQDDMFTPTLGGDNLNRTFDDTFASFTDFDTSSTSSSLLFNPEPRQSRRRKIPLKPNLNRTGAQQPVVRKEDADESLDDLKYLKRRIMRDKMAQSSVFIQREVRKKKILEKKKQEKQMVQKNAVQLLRSYRIGDFPDIRIAPEALVKPLQALTQKDSGISTLLFTSLVSALVQSNQLPSVKERFCDDLAHLLNNLLANSTDGPLISALHDICFDNINEFPQIHPEVISKSATASDQQNVAILWMEERVKRIKPEESFAGRRKRPRLSEASLEQPSTEERKLWLKIANLYKSIDMFDAVEGIFSSVMESKEIVLKGLESESLGDFSTAKGSYEQAIRELRQTGEDAEATELEEEILINYRINCLSQLCEWENLGNLMASAICPESKKPLAQIWATPDLLQEEWFPLFFRCQLKCFTDEKVSGPKEREAMKDFISKNLAERQEILENLYPKELAIFYLYGSGLETSKYYCDLTFKSIFNDWAATSYLMKNRRRSLLQSLQGLSEVVSFLSIAMASSLEIQREGFLRLIERFSIRTPDIQKDPSPMWDELLEYRSFFVHFMKSQWKDMNDTVSQRCQEAEFNFRLAFSESAAQQRNFEVALRELFICKGELWPSVSDPIAQMRFAEIYSKTHQLRARWGDPIRSSLGLITAIELLEKTPVNDDLRPIHVMLKGSNFESLSDACLREEFKLTTLTDNQKKRLFQLAGKGCETLSAARESFLTQSYNLYSQACVVELSTHFSFDRQKKFDNVHMTLADLCDKVLRSREDNLSTYSQLDVTEYPKALVNGILTAMKNGCEVAREKFARLLQIIELYPNCGDLFKERSAEVPSWMFLSWTPQIFALLDKPEAPLLQDIVWQLVNTYPNALIYPMKLSQENYNFTNDERGRKSRQFVDEIDTVFSKFPLIDKFISALEQLHQPDMIFKEICAKLEKLLKQSDKKEFICRFNDEMEKIFPKEDTHRSDSNRLPVGSYMSDFAKRQRSEFEKRFAVKQLKEMGLTEFNKAVSHVAIRPGEPPTTLRSYSPWLADFTPRKHNELELEIPGQYSGKRKPMPEYHVKISGFSDEITVMDSMRKPKSLTIRGNNEREYKFLVKCGEDLRQDQRLEQVFETINGILARDHLCRQRQLALRTYSVVPLTPRLGLIEFIPNVVGLKEFMLANPDFPYSDAARSKRFGYVRQYIDWPEDSRKFGDAYLKSYGKNEPQKVAEIFRKIEALVPDDSLSRSFLNLSASNEAFFILRNNFARTHAVLCVVHYLLGIGDRHLSNFLIDTTTGEIIGIDFGYAFGVSIQLIGVPELVPFRLTKTIRHAMGRVGLEGIFKSAAIHVLRACREEKSLLLNILDVFVKEPSLDWQDAAMRLESLKGKVEDINEPSLEWYPKEKLKVCRQKLTGVNPVLILRDEFKNGRYAKRPELDAIDACLFGKEKRGKLGPADLRYPRNFPPDQLSCQQQLECLISLATDPSLLSRMWQGWEPWV